MTQPNDFRAAMLAALPGIRTDLTTATEALRRASAAARDLDIVGGVADMDAAISSVQNAQKGLDLEEYVLRSYTPAPRPSLSDVRNFLDPILDSIVPAAEDLKWLDELLDDDGQSPRS